MRSRTLRIVVYDREREWLVPKTTFISWVNGQLVIQSAASKTRAEIQEFLRENNIRVVELVDSKELIIEPLELEELSISEANISTSDLLNSIHDEEF